MEDWRPDWRDESAYPDPETTTNFEWGWEFLRRRQDYQEDFVLFRQKYSDILANPLAATDAEMDNFFQAREKILLKYQIKTIGYGLPDPELPFKNLLFTRFTRRPAQIHNFFHDSFSKYTVGFHDKDQVNHMRVIPQLAASKEDYIGNTIRRGELDVHSSSLLCEINLDLPIPEQLKIIKKVAGILQEHMNSQIEKIKPRDKDKYKLRTYLRTLDALEENPDITGSELAKVFYQYIPDNQDPDKRATKTANNDKHAAKKILMSDYIYFFKL